MGLFSGGGSQRIEFVRMKGPQGKGHAEMAVTKPKGTKKWSMICSIFLPQKLCLYPPSRFFNESFETYCLAFLSDLNVPTLLFSVDEPHYVSF